MSKTMWKTSSSSLILLLLTCLMKIGEIRVTKCLPPPPITNGDYEPVDESYDYMNAVTFTCNPPYSLVGAQSISCSSDGTFKPSPPQCLEIKCDAPKIDNAVRIEETPGWKPSPDPGPDPMPDPTTALEIKCDAPKIDNAVRIEGKAPPYTDGNFVRYQCIKGYKMEGGDYLVCGVGGWNPPPPVCKGPGPGPGPNPGPDPGPGPTPGPTTALGKGLDWVCDFIQKFFSIFE